MRNLLSLPHFGGSVKMRTEEFLTLLKKHRISYDERYLWE